ncbi:MAG TPA: stage II sporulation protein M [Firmicutes bacterium]|jgi:stage II sporulation protein M|nr:stage II sporulation protein M [Bacillota bacterium]
MQNSSWIILAAFFFILGIVFSLLPLGDNELFFSGLTASQQQVLQEIAELIINSPPLAGIVLLFLNNLFASMYIVFLGIILGIPPLLGLFTNGAFLGTILTSLELGGINTLAFFSLGVLPHGVFELAAFFLSAAFGLKLGFHAIFPLPGKKRGEGIIFIWKEFWSVLPLILVLLAFAAAIEILITPRLLSLFGFPTI